MFRYLEENAIMGIINKLFEPIAEHVGNRIADSIFPKSAPLITRKFQQLFEEHRIEPSQIPLVIPSEFGINSKHVYDVDSLLDKLDSNLINWLSTHFNLNPNWFHHEDATVYDEKFVYKSSINNFVDLLVKKQQSELLTNFVIIKTSGELYSHSRIKMLLLEHHDTNNVEYVTHTLMKQTFPWGHSGSQVILMIRMFYSLSGLGYIRGESISERQMDLLEKGKVFINNIKFKRNGHWVPDAYSMFDEESLIACNGDNLQAIIDWGYNRNFIQYYEEKTGISLKNSKKLGGINSVLVKK